MPRLRSLLRYAVLALAGVLQAWSIAWPWGGAGYGQAFGSLQIAALALAVWVLMTCDQADASHSFSHAPVTPRRRFWINFRRAWWFATVWLSAIFWWLYISMHVYGGMPSWLAALAVVLLAGALALYYALALALWLWAQARWSVGGKTALFAMLWLLAELCRGVLFTGFPWGAIGYAHVDSWLAGYAPWLGVYGIAVLAAALSVLLSQVVHKLVLRERTKGLDAKRPRSFAAVSFLVVVVLALGAWQKSTLGKNLKPVAGSTGLHVALLQGNIPQEEKFQPNGGMQKALQWYGEQMVQAQADLTVLPETALPLFPQELPEGYWQGLQQRFAGGQQAVLIGLPTGDLEKGYANAVVGMAPGGVQTAGAAPQADLSLPPAQQAEYRYAKHHLVPFGEFIPFGFQWFVDMMRMPLGSYQRGALAQPRMVLKGERLQPNICYEDLFGEELAASFIDPATAPTILVNVSNIGWFGDTVAIDQHRHISRMRAMELARPMLRATNTGSTAVIDAGGQVLHEQPRLTRGVLQAQVMGNDAPPTFFAWWAARWGLWPLWVVALLVSAGLLLRKERASRL
ncbi:MAG: apolipoprotein N-acyltransferase [Brachymonas sp.]|nr:apolipoprotein N-acyltransferase [Brachymonas sp.]